MMLDQFKLHSWDALTQGYPMHGHDRAACSQRLHQDCNDAVPDTASHAWPLDDPTSTRSRSESRLRTSSHSHDPSILDHDQRGVFRVTASDRHAALPCNANVGSDRRPHVRPPAAYRAARACRTPHAGQHACPLSLPPCALHRLAGMGMQQEWCPGTACGTACGATRRRDERRGEGGESKQRC